MSFRHGDKHRRKNQCLRLDLAVSVLGGVILAENDGNQKFKLHDTLATSDDTQSMAAADYDQDGDIDFYVCVYRRDGKDIRGNDLVSAG